MYKYLVIFFKVELVYNNRSLDLFINGVHDKNVFNFLKYLYYLRVFCTNVELSLFFSRS